MEGCPVKAKKFINTAACNISKESCDYIFYIRTMIYYAMNVSACNKAVAELVNLCICNWCQFTVDVTTDSK